MPAREGRAHGDRNRAPTCGYKKFSIAEPGPPDRSDSVGRKRHLRGLGRSPRHPFVTDRLAAIIRKEKLSGAKIDFLRKKSPWSGERRSTPGSLFQWMPEERASQPETAIRNLLS